ncbi:TonB-dependent receptor [Hydrogenimonas sp.]
MKKHLLLLSAAAAALLAEEATLAPVSVVATGVEESVVEQPEAIAIKEKPEIELDQVVFQKDLFNSLPGVRIEQTGSVFGHMTAIRMPINTGPYYLFMQDGIPVQSSGFFNHNGLAYTTFGTAESVEVLKGAGTALYGSDAVAAVIDVHSTPAPSEKRTFLFKGTGGMYGYGSGLLEASGPAGEEGGYFANVHYLHSDGWRDHTQADRLEANGRYDLAIGDANALKIILNASKTEAQQADSFNDYANITDRSKAASDDPNYFKALEYVDVKRKFDYARLSLEWSNFSFENLDIVTTPYLRYNRNRYIATWQPNLPANDNELTTLGLLQRNTYQADWGRVIFGFDTEYTRSSLTYDQKFDIQTSGWSAAYYQAGTIYDYDVDYFAIAPYAHLEWNMSDKVVFSAGLRYDYNKFDYTNNLEDDSYYYALTSKGQKAIYYRPGDRTDSFNHVSPKASLSFMPDATTNLYIRYANGFRIPQASRLYSMKAGYETVTLDPETSDTYEIGLKKFFARHTFVDLAAYYMNIDDTITRYKNDNGDYYYANGGSSIHEGVEVGAGYAFNPSWRFKIAYAYGYHRYDNDPKYGDNEMAQAPNHTGNIRLFWTPWQFPGFELMAEYIYVGSWWFDDDHEAGKYKGYQLGNLKASYRYDDHLKLFAKIDNVTDNEYAVMARYAYGKTDYTPGDPALAYLGVEYRW